MNATRREFIGGACSALFGCGLAPDTLFGADGAPLVRFGAISDVHLKKPGDERTLVRALEYFRDNGADAVLVAGDIADRGLVSQFELFAATWFRVFPNDRAPDGRKVERLFIYGNHDLGKRKETMASLTDATRGDYLYVDDNGKKAWERLFHEEYRPIWKKEVKGITFIGAHWPGPNRIEAYMAEHGRELDPSLPFFYTQHQHPAGTCFGDWAWGRDKGESTRALSPYPNAVAISGHSHSSLTDERNFWQGAFTSFGAASLRYLSRDYLGFENAPRNSFDPRKAEWLAAHPGPPVMHWLETVDGRQGMLVDVHRDRLIVRRREFVHGRSLGDDLTLPIPAKADGPFSYARAAKARSAPEFASGAEAKAALVETAPSCASGAVKKCGPFVHVTFPAARTVAKCRVFGYEVRAVDAEGRTLVTRRVLAPGFYLGEEDCALPGECLFLVSELPAEGTVRFEVRPEECFGRQGRPIVSAEVRCPAKGTGA